MSFHFHQWKVLSAEMNEDVIKKNGTKPQTTVHIVEINLTDALLLHFFKTVLNMPAIHLMLTALD